MITIKGGQDLITIDVLETILEHRGDRGAMKWQIYAESSGFTGGYDEVWIWPTAYERFLEELVVLERFRQGAASLVSTSQIEFVLTLRSIDRAGHLIAEGQLGRYRYVGDELHFTKVVFAFEIDPTTLPELVKEFAALRIW